MIDARDSSGGLNASTWEYGKNYVQFGEVEADIYGKITLNGDAADVGDYGETYATRLPLSGFQIIETAPAPPSMSYINVNMYASNGGDQDPEDPATLVGPAGGLGETWNQFNTTTGSALLSATGDTTSVGYTNNVGSGWAWGNPELNLLDAGKAPFDASFLQTHTITGLTPGSVYDVWVASANTLSSQQSEGEWSTPNNTDSPSIQPISNVGAINGSTWEYGNNYVLFEKVEVDSNGHIVLNGQGLNGYRLPLSGFQLTYPIPEPSTAILAGLGLVALCFRRRK